MREEVRQSTIVLVEGVGLESGDQVRIITFLCCLTHMVPRRLLDHTVVRSPGTLPSSACCRLSHPHTPGLLIEVDHVQSQCSPRVHSDKFEMANLRGKARSSQSDTWGISACLL